MIRVNYNGMIADVRDEDLEAGIASLSACSPRERRRIMKSVERALKKAMKRADMGRAAFTEKQLRDTANARMYQAVVSAYKMTPPPVDGSDWL